MLFFAFLNIRINRHILRKEHLYIIVLNLILPIIVFSLIQFWNHTVAIAVGLIALAPTGAVSTVWAAMFKKKIEFVTASVFLTSLLIAFVTPIVLSFFTRSGHEVSVTEILLPVMTVLIGPLLISQVIKRFLPRLASGINKRKGIVFYFFIAAAYLASAKASHFIREDQETDLAIILTIATAVAVLCALQYFLGEWVGRKYDSIEVGLGLGRKNTVFSLWLGLTFINPVAALGPIFYILFQNIYNSIQMYYFERKGNVRGIYHFLSNSNKAYCSMT